MSLLMEETKHKDKLFRIATVPMSLDLLLKGQLKFLNNKFNLTAISGEGIELRKVELREGVKVYPIKINRNISILNDFISLTKLYFYFKKEKPLIVHSITPKAGLLSMVAAWLAKVPLRIHTYTGLIFPYKIGVYQKVLIFMDKILCLCATNIYPEGEGVKFDLERFSITKKQLKVLGNGNVNGIDISYFDPNCFSKLEKDEFRKNLLINEDSFVFIFIGRLVGDKGVNELIKAFNLINESNERLLLVGGLEDKIDPLKEETLIEMYNNPNIISVGFMDDVRPYLAISDTLVFPSYREGFPNVVIQAGAMGLPAIVSDINGCNEIIIEGRNGTMIPCKNVDALVNAMVRMKNDRIFRCNLRENARKMIIDRYDQLIVWNSLQEEYKILIETINNKDKASFK